MTRESSQDTRRRERLDVGLYRRVTKAGETRYDVAVWRGGRQQLGALRKGTTEAQARKAALRARAAASEGSAPLATAMRFSDLAAEYLVHAEARTKIVGKGRMSATTVQTYRSRLAMYVAPTLGRRKLSQLGRGDVLRVLDACHAEGFSDWTTHGVLVAFRACLRYARERDYMTADPFASVPQDRLPAQRARSETRALRPNEVGLVLDRLARKKPEALARREFALGSLLADAGLRVSESLGLTWADVSLSEGVLDVRGQLAPLRAGESPAIVPPKSRRSYRTVPLLPRLQAALEALYAGEDDAEFVLRTRRGTPLSQRNAGRSIEKAGDEAGLGRVTPHVLRRSYGTALSEAHEVSPASAANMMGHSLEVFHGSYVKAHRDELERERAREALVRLGLGVVA
jgi:integrase